MRVEKVKTGSVQQQALAVKVLAKEAVMLAVTVGGVADHVVGNVFQVTAELVLAPRFRA